MEAGGAGGGGRGGWKSEGEGVGNAGAGPACDDFELFRSSISWANLTKPADCLEII